MTRLRYSEKGFTLIELLIVILILGIIAATVVPNVARFMQSGKKGAAELELGSVQVAVYAAMAKQGVGTIDGAAAADPVDSGNGVIHDEGLATEIDIDDYLQGGVAQLKGAWTVGDTGLVTGGSYPVAPPHWVYVVIQSPQWEYQE